MKELTNAEVKFIVENCDCESNNKTCSSCPLSAECLYYYTGEKCGSCLEKEG